jgi:hypothetical protein
MFSKNINTYKKQMLNDHNQNNSSIIEQVKQFYNNQKHLVDENLNSYDKEVEEACNIKENCIRQHQQQELDQIIFELDKYEKNFQQYVDERIEKSKQNLAEKHKHHFLNENNKSSELLASINQQVSDCQNKMLQRVANLRNELNLDDDFLNGYGNFKNEENCEDCEDCEECDDCEDCEDGDDCDEQQNNDIQFEPEPEPESEIIEEDENLPFEPEPEPEIIEEDENLPFEPEHQKHNDNPSNAEIH